MKKRSYDSRARLAAAARTRERILAAARKLFSKRGFEQVTVDQLAAEADVSSPTIFALFHSKSGILKALMQAALFNDRYDALVQKAMASDDPVERIRMAAAIARTVHDGAKSETGLLRGASAFSRELQSIERAGEQQRLERQEPTIALLFRKRLAASGLDVPRARDLLWALTGRDLYRMLVLDRGWASDAYEEWLAEILVRTLVRTDGSRPPSV